MLKRICFSLLILAVLAGCGPTVTPTPTATTVPSATVPPAPPTATTTSVPTATPPPSATPTQAPPTATPAPTYPPAGYGPTNFPAGIDPLTGLQVANPDLLNRRPIVIKVENLPRSDRPQFGLTAADIVYEYYTELGSTRFAAIYYGQNATQVGPIRSARWFDFNVVQMYKAIFAFGYAYADLYSALASSDFASRLILEGSSTSPALFRYRPDSVDYLMTDTSLLNDVLTKKKINNDKQNLDGMAFNQTTPASGSPATRVFVRYSAAIYNRWDFDTTTGKYLRFVDNADDPNRNNEVYTQLTDRANNQPITADNVVMVFVPHQYVVKTATTEVLNMKLIGTGKAYVTRDGQLFQVKWKRAKASDVMTFVNADGTPFALKPGQTWIEVLGQSSTFTNLKNGAFRFSWLIP
jgi:hypothetical protein